MSAHLSTKDLSPKPEARPVGTRLRRRPVHGSVVLGLMPAQPQPRATWVYLYPVSDTSPGRARLDTRLFLASCPDIPGGLSESAVLLVSELVTNAFEAMSADPFPGIACVELSLRLFDDQLLIEVIDSSRKSPAPGLTGDTGAENGRGLAVVDHVSQEWGYFWRTGRKVVYCILPLPAADGSPA